MKIIHNITLGNLEIDFALRIQKKRELEMYGFTNLCEDGKYIVLLDYDGFELEWVELIIRNLQELYHLSDAHIFKSSENSYHVVFFDKFPLSELMKILKSSSTDPNFVFVPLQYGKRLWTLRLTEKKGKRPTYIKTIKSIFNEYQKSTPHITLLENLYDLKINRKNEDKLEYMISSSYKIK